MIRCLFFLHILYAKMYWAKILFRAWVLKSRKVHLSWLRARMAHGKKVLLILSVLAFSKQKHFPEHNRRESTVRMTELLHNLPSLGPASIAVDRLQVMELSADSVLGWSHHPPKILSILLSAVLGLVMLPIKLLSMVQAQKFFRGQFKVP